MIRSIALLFIGPGRVGCGVGMPPPTTQEVTVTDIAGPWEYTDTFGRDKAQITFDTNGTFALVFLSTQSPMTNSGTWSLTDSSHLKMTPFWTSSMRTRGSYDEHESITWWITSWYTKGVAPFGGDSVDPDQWVVLWRPGK
jgi:hypothetical protein